MLAGDLVGGLEQAALISLIALGASLVLTMSPVRRRRITAALALLSFGFACAAAAAVYHPQLPADHVAARHVPAGARIEGVLLADAENRGGNTRLLLEVERLETRDGVSTASGRLLLYVREVGRAWSAGERLRATAFLRHPRNFGNPEEFDYRGYLARRGVYVTGFAADDSSFELLAGGGSAVAAFFNRWRRDLRRLFDDNLAPGDAAVLRALVLGDAGAMSEDLQQAFSRSGVRHVLTISGLHISMVAASSYALMLWLLGRSRRLLLAANVPKLAVAPAMIPVVVYAGLAGGGLATTRAVVMGLVFLGAVTVDRRRHMLVSLAAAAILLVLTCPGATQDISFQLSFVAVLGLTLGLERFWPWWLAREEEWLFRLRGRRAMVWRWIAVYLAVSGAALAATIPLTAFHFNQVSLMALLSNAVVVPLLGSAAVACGLVAAALHLIVPPMAVLCVSLAGAAVYVGIAAVRVFAAVPYASFFVVTPTKIEVALIYAALLAAVCMRGRYRVAALALSAALVCIDAGWWYGKRWHHGELRVTFLSVGQGDSAVVEFPNGEVMVVDGGGLGGSRFDVGARVVAPYLWSRRIGRVDYLVATHPQWDHYGGLRFLAENFGPREFWSSGAISAAPSYARLLDALSAGAVRQRRMRSGDRLSAGGVDVEIISPGEGAAELGINDRSLVVRLAYAGRRVLLSGDIEAVAEAALLRRSSGLLRSDVIKVPHHGSATSSTAEFVAAVQPRLAVMSAGLGNRYGFPSPAVLGRYAAVPSRVLRTDLDGAVEVRIGPSGLAGVRWAGQGRWQILERSKAKAPAGGFEKSN
jgi:competence protein ComEC